MTPAPEIAAKAVCQSPGPRTTALLKASIRALAFAWPFSDEEGLTVLAREMISLGSQEKGEEELEKGFQRKVKSDS